MRKGSRKIQKKLQISKPYVMLYSEGKQSKDCNEEPMVESVSSGIHDWTKERANKNKFLFLSLNLLTEYGSHSSP